LQEADLASTDLARTILLVEDEAFAREVACEVLSRAGYRVLKAGNAKEAVKIFVVLLDRNGRDLATDLATLGDGVKSIFVSGYPENPITKRGLKQPGWFYCPNPFQSCLCCKKLGRLCPTNLFLADGRDKWPDGLARGREFTQNHQVYAAVLGSPFRRLVGRDRMIGGVASRRQPFRCESVFHHHQANTVAWPAP
jgi:hypothetical protein